MERILNENEKLRSQVAVSEKVSAELKIQMYKLEKEFNKNSQYSRRETIEIAGIPVSVSDNDLETKCIEIFGAIGVDIDANDLHACHRIKNSRTIVKFISRKMANKVLKNKYKLSNFDVTKFGFAADDKIFINESLCLAYREILYYCKKLKKNGLIFHVRSSDGTIKYRLVEKGTLHPVYHIDDFKISFPGFNFTQQPAE